MSSVDKALATQIENLQKRSGKSLKELYAIIRKSGLAKHGEIRDMLKSKLKMGHGDANTVVHCFMQENSPAQDSKGTNAPSREPADQLYTGTKEHLRPIHDKLMEAIGKFGEFEIAPKKAYVSLRRKKQFATIGPATQTRVEVGLNMKGVKGTDRLEPLPAGGMCQYRVKVTDPKQVDKQLVAWIKQAFDSAG
jgi:hypothetical protein